MNVRGHWLIYHLTILSCMNVLIGSGKQQIKTVGEKEKFEEIEAGRCIDSQRSAIAHHNSVERLQSSSWAQTLALPPTYN